MMGTSDIHRKSVRADDSVEFDEAIVLTGKSPTLKKRHIILLIQTKKLNSKNT